MLFLELIKYHQVKRAALPKELTLQQRNEFWAWERQEWLPKLKAASIEFNKLSPKNKELLRKEIQKDVSEQDFILLEKKGKIIPKRLHSTEDYTDYTETDPDEVYTVISSKITYTEISRDAANAYVYDDKGSGHFDGDFEHLCEIEWTDQSNNGRTYVWGLGNSTNILANTHLGLRDGSYLLLTEQGNTSDNTSHGEDTRWYLEIERDESVGTYGTLYCRIYSDSGRTTLVDTLSVTLAAKTDFRYIFGAAGDDDNSSSRTITGYVQNLDLQESASSGTSLQINIGDSWKEVAGLQINIGDSWKEITGVQINIGDTWKTVF